MIARFNAIIAGAALAAALGLPAVCNANAHPTQAIAPVAQNPCAAPLPLQAAFGGGVGTLSTLQGGGYTFRLFRFVAPGLRAELPQFGIKPLAGDNPATFSFVLPHGRHRYDGLAHVFQSGPWQHVCYQGSVYVDGGTSAAFIAHPRTAMMRLDGTIAGAWARVDVWIGDGHYYVFGRMRSR